MIGDDIKDDVIGAQKCDFQGCLVKTGKYAPHDESALHPETPHYVFESVVEAIDVFVESYVEDTTE